MRALFDGLQIKTKLVMIIVITSLAALLIQAAGFIVYERMRVKDELVRDLSSLARIVADRSTAALIFNDDKVAIETLGALKVKRPVTAACLYDAEGKVFARYDSGEERPFAFPPLRSTESRADIEDGYLSLSEPVMEGGVPIGTVFIRASLRELDLLWRNYLLFAGLIAAATAALTLLVATRWQRIVSGPIERLTQTMQTISTSKDYSVRAGAENRDEIGTLVAVFNGMLETIEEHRFDALIGGARRDEEKARAKERIFSHRDSFGQWQPKAQRPELWTLFNTRLQPGEHFRVFPISNWTELDVWQYIDREQIGLPSIYYTHKRQVVDKKGLLMPVTELTPAREGDVVESRDVRFRTVGDITCTAPVESTAATPAEIVIETLAADVSERGATRMDDKTSDASMEKRKKDGYF